MASGQRCRETAVPRSSSSAKHSRAEGTACQQEAREVEGCKKEIKGSLPWKKECRAQLEKDIHSL